MMVVNQSSGQGNGIGRLGPQGVSGRGGELGQRDPRAGGGCLGKVSEGRREAAGEWTGHGEGGEACLEEIHPTTVSPIAVLVREANVERHPHQKPGREESLTFGATFRALLQRDQRVERFVAVAQRIGPPTTVATSSGRISRRQR